MEQATFAELEHEEAPDAARTFSGGDGRAGSVGGSRSPDRTVLSEARPRRRPHPLRTMLRVDCVQLWYDLSDPGTEDLLYEVESARRFVGLRPSGTLPDETTILKFPGGGCQRRCGSDPKP